MSLLDRLCETPLDDLAALARAASDAEEHEARTLLESLPVPLHRDEPPELRKQRQHLRRFLAERAAARGDLDALADTLSAESWEGGSAVPWLRYVMEHGNRAEAAMRARVRARIVGEPERSELEALAREAAHTDGAFADALAAFAEAPTSEGWDALMRFCPSGMLFERTQQAMRLLRSSGADLDAVYLAVAPVSVTSELTGMVEDGLVSTAAVERSLDEVYVSDIARGMMLMSAALGAQARGDKLAVVRLVRAAGATGTPEELLQPTLQRILEDADPELRAMLR